MGGFKDMWFNHNDYDQNEDYIEKLLKRFDITKYNPTINVYGCSDLVIEKNLKKYKIELDTIECVANIKRCKVRLGDAKFSKEYMPTVKVVDKTSIWYDCLKWIDKDSKIA